MFSLYGQTQKPPADMLTNIDEYMRTFDTQHAGKRVEPGMMNSVDVMVFDLQDVGTRVYTYLATMAYAMQAAADADIPFIVLDRPNPIGGVADGRADFGISQIQFVHRPVSRFRCGTA